MSGIGESNPSIQLGKLTLNRSTNPASESRGSNSGPLRPKRSALPTEPLSGSAGGGTRTRKALRPQDFKSCVYTNFTTSAFTIRNYSKIFSLSHQLCRSNHSTIFYFFKIYLIFWHQPCYCFCNNSSKIITLPKQTPFHHKIHAAFFE